MNDAAIPLPDITADADPMRMLADLADYAMRLARLAVEQYEALVKPKPGAAPDSAKTRKLPDPGTLFTRAARLVLDCITKQSRLAAGLPLSPPARVPATPHAAPCPKPPSAPACGEAGAETVRQALRILTRNLPDGNRRLQHGLAQLSTALATAAHAPLSLPELFVRICEQTGLRPTQSQLRKLAADPALHTLIPAPA